jgi:hypothetical protein
MQTRERNYDLSKPLRELGLRTLLDLCGINDIRVCDIDVEAEMEKVNDVGRPDYKISTDCRLHVALDRVPRQLNSALVDVQRKKVK